VNRISEAINAPGRARVARDGARPVFRSLVRAGFVARAVTYGVIGALALAIALGAGTGGAAPDQAGALALIARAPLGRAALVLICAGLLAYAVWKLTEGIRGGSGEGEGQPKPWDRVSNVAGGGRISRVLRGRGPGTDGQRRGLVRHPEASSSGRARLAGRWRYRRGPRARS